MSTKPLDAFDSHLAEGLREIAAQRGWNVGNAKQAGDAFVLWYAALVSQAEPGVELVDLYFANDFKIDAVFRDDDAQQLLVCQCKKAKFFDRDECELFFGRHTKLANRAYLEELDTTDEIIALGDLYAQLVKDGYSVEYRWVTTAKAGTPGEALQAEAEARAQDDDLPLTFAVQDYAVLRRYWESAQTRSAPLPDITLQLPEKHSLDLSSPSHAIIAIVKGNSIRNLYNETGHQERLFEPNVRGFLGKTKFNRGIRATIKDEPQRFMYYNNGISAVCKSFEVDEKNVLRAKAFAIINGAQTVKSLALEKPDDSVRVLLRVTAVGDIYEDSAAREFAESITEFNNSQNAVQLSDFRGNDDIQKWLQRSLVRLPVKGSLAKQVVYLRKRGEDPNVVAGKKVTGTTTWKLSLADLAKRRYAALHSPDEVHAGLGTLVDPTRAYWKAFGVSTSDPPWSHVRVWADEDMWETTAIIAAFEMISGMIVAAAGTEHAFVFHDRLKYHHLRLAYDHLLERKVELTRSWKRMMQDDTVSEEIKKTFPLFRVGLKQSWLEFEKEFPDSTIFTFIRRPQAIMLTREKIAGLLEAQAEL